MDRAIRVYEAGGPDVMTLEEIKVGTPGIGEVVVRHTAIGVNLIDTYHRSSTSGQYAIPRPAILGVEAAGVVEAAGDGVTNVQPGDRVAYWNLIGAYTTRRLVPAWKLVKIPDQVCDETAAAMMLKGSTAQYLLHRIYPVTKGDVVLIHAAAGGVGKLLCQWSAFLGASVIGTVGSREKVAVAVAAGCAHVIVSREQDVVAEVRKITAGAGVDVVYDSIGRDTFETSLDTLRPVGMMVNFGQASGPVPPFDISILAAKGSILLAKPTLATFVKTAESIRSLANGVFEALRSGAIRPEIGLTARLADVADVHRAMEGRKTTGSTVLLP